MLFKCIQTKTNSYTEKNYQKYCFFEFLFIKIGQILEMILINILFFMLNLKLLENFCYIYDHKNCSVVFKKKIKNILLKIFLFHKKPFSNKLN